MRLAAQVWVIMTRPTVAHMLVVVMAHVIALVRVLVSVLVSVTCTAISQAVPLAAQRVPGTDPVVPRRHRAKLLRAWCPCKAV